MPAGPSAETTGVDDYLATGHSVDELLALAVPELRINEKSNEKGLHTTKPLSVANICPCHYDHPMLIIDALGSSCHNRKVATGHGGCGRAPGEWTPQRPP